MKQIASYKWNNYTQIVFVIIMIADLSSRNTWFIFCQVAFLTYRMSKKSRTGEIFWNLSISERSISYKSCRVSNDQFTDLINLTLTSLQSSQGHIDFFNWHTLFLITESNKYQELFKTLQLSYFS